MICRVSTIQESKAHSDDGVAHAEGEVLDRLPARNKHQGFINFLSETSCDHMGILGSCSEWKVATFSFQSFGLVNLGIDILSLYVPGKYPKRNSIFIDLHLQIWGPGNVEKGSPGINFQGLNSLFIFMKCKVGF